MHTTISPPPRPSFPEAHLPELNELAHGLGLAERLASIHQLTGYGESCLISQWGDEHWLMLEIAGQYTLALWRESGQWYLLDEAGDVPQEPVTLADFGQH